MMLQRPSLFIKSFSYLGLSAKSAFQKRNYRACRSKHTRSSESAYADIHQHTRTRTCMHMQKHAHVHRPGAGTLAPRFRVVSLSDLTLPHPSSLPPGFPGPPRLPGTSQHGFSGREYGSGPPELALLGLGRAVLPPRPGQLVSQEQLDSGAPRLCAWWRAEDRLRGEAWRPGPARVVAHRPGPALSLTCVHPVACGIRFR